MAAAGFPLGMPYAEGFGHVCARCDALAPIEAVECPRCATALVPSLVAPLAPTVHAPEPLTPNLDPLLSTQPDLGHSPPPEPAVGPTLPAPPEVEPLVIEPLIVEPIAPPPPPTPPTPAAPVYVASSTHDTGPVSAPRRADEPPPAIPVAAPHLVATTPAPAPATPLPSAPKRSLRGAVLEVPAAPGTALKDGQLLDRDAQLAPEVSARIARITSPQSPLRSPGQGTSPSMPAHPAPPTVEETSALGASRDTTAVGVLHAQPGAHVPLASSAPVHTPPHVQGAHGPAPRPHIVEPALPSTPTAPSQPAVVLPAAAPVEARAHEGATRPCPQCGNSVPATFLFCGQCGHRMEAAHASVPRMAPATPIAPPAPQHSHPAPARLVLIKGEGIDGVAYPLAAHDHVAGRTHGMILFPDDRFLSQRQANFQVRDGRVFLRDEGSVNGVYVRLRAPVELQDGDMFLCGEEVLRFEVLQMPRPAELVSEDGTVFYGTPLRDGVGCRIVQLLLGGRMGMVYIPTKPQTLIGREGCDVSFPRDRFISGRHTKLEAQGRTFTLHDLGSKNGTYLRIRQERELAHGDFVFLGQQLFRVEIAAA